MKKAVDNPRADPDLYGLWVGGTNRSDARPSRDGKGFDFQETSTGMHRTVIKKVAKSEFGLEDKDYSGAYICVKAYGDGDKVSFTLSASLTKCPGDFTEEGLPLECSSGLDAADVDRRYDSCSEEGQCLCRSPWAQPVPEVFPGLGFEDCSANVTMLNSTVNGTLTLSNQYSVPDKWNFYQFEVGQGDFQVIINVSEEETKGFVDMYLKAGTPPGFGPQQFDLRPAWSRATDERGLEVAMDPNSTNAYRRGTWFLGIVGDHQPTSYTLTITKNECLMNCSGHGECTEHRCQCEDGYGGEDCSQDSRPLLFNETVTRDESSFEFDYYILPSLNEVHSNVEVTVEASYHSTGYGRWLEVRPSILLARQNGSGKLTFPTVSNYSHKLTLDEQNVTRTLALCPTRYRESNWTLAVFNPMRTIDVGYTLVVKKIGHCLNHCSDHGQCNADGRCECQANWAGGDCSVDVSGGGGRHGHSIFASWFFGALVGACSVLGSIWYRGGVPPWMPLRTRRFTGLGLYQELSDVEGI